MSPPFCLKSNFGCRGVIFFIPNVDSVLGLAYPENLSSIGLIIEAVDTFQGAGASAGASAGVGARCYYTENLSLIGFWL